MTVASRAVMMAVMTEARTTDVEQEGHTSYHSQMWDEWFEQKVLWSLTLVVWTSIELSWLSWLQRSDVCCVCGCFLL